MGLATRCSGRVDQPWELGIGTCPMIVRSIAGGVEVLAPAKLNLFLEVLGRQAGRLSRDRVVDGRREPVRHPDLHRDLIRERSACGATIRACRSGVTTWSSRRPSVSRRRQAVLAAHGSASPRRSRRRRGWLAVRATRRRRWRLSTGSGTCGCPRTGWTRWRERSAATWPSSCTHRRRFAAGGASASRP